MTHPLVTQLRFARREFVRALDGVTDDEARRRFEPINSISWMVGHLASQEHRYWLVRWQDVTVAPEVDQLCGYGKPASTPPLDEMWDAWRRVTAATDPYLEELTTETLQTAILVDGKPWDETIGTMIRRVTYHYWFHTGESQAVRQLLGHKSLPEFVGDIGEEAPYIPES